MNIIHSKLDSYLYKVVVLCAIIVSAFTLYTSIFGTLAGPIQKSIHLILMVPIAFYFYPQKSIDKEQTFNITSLVFKVALTVITLVTIGEYYLKWEKLFISAPNTSEIILGIIGIVLILEVTRRSIGWSLPIISILFLVYAYLGPLFPRMMQHKGFTLGEIAQWIFYGNEGVFGDALGVAATYVMMFILLAAFLEKSNTSELLMDLANSVTGKNIGGTAKISLVGSAFMGMLSGSTAANVAGSGAVTIPMMKKSGFSGAKAGAIEAVASTGGQILPPVMGVTVFVMMEFTGLSFFEIIMAALVPALAYFIIIYIRIHIYSVKQGILGLPTEEVPKFLSVMRGGFHLLIPLIVLIVLLGLQYTPLYAASYSIISLVVVMITVKLLRKLSIINFGYKTEINLSLVIESFVLGAKRTAPVSMICACAGIIASVMSMTGLGLQVSTIIRSMSGDYTIIALLLTAVICLILGMGIPTIAAYIIVSITAVPVLLDFGFPLLESHLFVFYFAALSHLTPPVAIGAYVAAGLAESSPMKTAVEAFKFGTVIYLIPFLWMYRPGITMNGPPIEIVFSIMEFAFILLSATFLLERYMFRFLSVFKCSILLIIILLIIIPSNLLSIISIILFSVFVLYEKFNVKRIEQKAA